MISIGGVIGTGLFLGTANALRDGGPIGLLLGYMIIGSLCWSVMNSLGEMVSYLPIPGGHIKLSERFVDPALSFAMGWNYWYNWTMGIPTELSAASILIEFWIKSDKLNSAWISICLVVVIVINVLGAGAYGEAEFIFASIKVITIVGLIILGIVLDLGGGPSHDRIGFRYWQNPGPFAQFNGIPGSKGQFLGWWSVMTQAAFSFLGTESVAIAAGEAKNPRRNIPKAIKRVYIRILLFYIGGTIIIGLLVPSNEPRLKLDTTLGSTTGSSPFVIAIKNAGIDGLPSVINAALLTSAWSAASSCLYTSSRTLYGLGTTGNAPKFVLLTTKHGLPYVSLIICSVFSGLAYMAVSAGAGKVFGWFQNMCSVAGLMTWFAISVTYLRFYAGLKAQGYDRTTLPFYSRLQPYAAWYTQLSGWKVFLKGNWATDVFITNYLPLVMFPIMYFGAKVARKTKIVRPIDMDFETGLAEVEAESYDEPPPKDYSKASTTFPQISTPTMPRPRPLTSASNDYEYSFPGQSQLTPRTPHSRAGRAEEARGEIQIIQEDDDDDETGNLQNVPLLRSSASDSFPATGYRGRGDDPNQHVHRSKKYEGLTLKTIASRLPVVIGSMVAGLLLVLLVVSYQKPGTLEQYMGAVAPSSENQETDLTNTTALNSSSEHHHHHHVDPATVISYENYTTFPLKPEEYVKECGKLVGGWMPAHGGYWEIPAAGVKDVVHDSGPPVCNSTITYMLSGKVGLVADLALMAQAAALAREVHLLFTERRRNSQRMQRNRTFFVDDRYWDRGKWTDHFQDVRITQPGPEPECQAAPPEELVACPRHARHWLVNAGTARYHFGHGYHEAYEDPYGHNLNRAKPLYEMAAESLSTTIRPNAKNVELISAARKELSGLASETSTDYISVHIRRGDNEPSAWKYVSAKIQVPIEEFVDASTETWKRLSLAGSQPLIYVASDSPAASTQFSEANDEWRTFSLFQSQNADLKALASPEQYFQNNFDRLYEEDERINLTRGMVVDLALLSGLWGDGEIKPQAVVCTKPSAICKLSAVGFGWNGAFGEVDDMGEIDQERKRWVEIDEKSAITPTWEAYDLF
ncbi:hypothetical protein V5O48_006165 [Marasmius crinis-equi]|uniref:Amino acid permease/ SLC12A domain-containing protein n=1 Tax=Marasmius crinis-equi TaxID=585013 RepID=A0ABR3FK87_9AGAR